MNSTQRLRLAVALLPLPTALLLTAPFFPSAPLATDVVAF
jgi:hypothetical protein